MWRPNLPHRSMYRNVLPDTSYPLVAELGVRDNISPRGPVLLRGAIIITGCTNITRSTYNQRTQFVLVWPCRLRSCSGMLCDIISRYMLSTNHVQLIRYNRMYLINSAVNGSQYIPRALLGLMPRIASHLMHMREKRATCISFASHVQ